MGTDEIIAGYLLQQKRLGHTPTTIKNRKVKLKALAGWLAPQGLTFTAATKADLERFLDDRKFAEGGRGRYDWVSLLHVFYKWLIDEGVIEESPAEGLTRSKVRRGLPRPISYEHVRDAAEAAGPMMRCWILLAGLNGLRCMEIAGLRRENVQELVENPTLRIDGKGGKVRSIPAHPDVLTALEDYGMPKRGLVFVGKEGVGFSPAHVSARINRYLRASGINATAHQLRHSFATELLHVSGNIYVVQKVLGHSDASTTSVYAQLRDEDQIDAMRKLHLPDDDAVDFIAAGD